MLCLFISCTSYQRIDYTNQSQEVPELYKQNIEKYKAANKRILYNAYQQYVAAADLVDSTGFVTENSVLDFKFLFESGARIINDIQLYPEEDKKLLDANYYADLVSTYMNRKGVITEFEKHDINSFFANTGDQFNPRVDDSDDDDLIFFYTFNTIKKNYTILNKNNQVLYYDEAIEYPITITFRISIKNESADIISILPQKIKP
jgi:hypothetical protein